MIKRIAIAWAILLCVSLLAGCGGGTGPESGTGAEPGVSAASGAGAGSGAGTGADTGAGATSDIATDNGASAGAGASAGTGPDTPAEPAVPDILPATMRLGGLRGPTTMGMVKLLDDASAGATFNHYDFTIAGAADELTPLLIRGELDIVAMPANLAAVLYNNTGGAIQLLAVNTLGVTYIVETGDEIHSFADLQGKTVYATGRGAVPEYTLRYLLEANGIDPDRDVALEWRAEPPEVVAILGQTGGVAMLPQPFVTVAQNTLPDLRIALNMTEAWEALDNGSSLITGVLAVRRDFAAAYPDQIAIFLDEYRASADFVNANVAEAAIMVEAWDIVRAPIAEIAIPYCHIVFLEGAEMRRAIAGYLDVLYAQNPRSVGDALPGDDFYYQR